MAIVKNKNPFQKHAMVTITILLKIAIIPTYLMSMNMMETSLHKAVKNNSIAAVKDALHKELIDIDAIDVSGDTALHVAAVWNRRRILKYLIFQGANVSLKNKNGVTAFQLTKYNPDTEKTKRYFELATNFYLAIENHMTFDTFVKNWLTTDKNIRFIGRLLFIQPLNKTKQFASKFYDWCKKKNKFELSVPKLSDTTNIKKIKEEKTLEPLNQKIEQKKKSSLLNDQQLKTMPTQKKELFINQEEKITDECFFMDEKKIEKQIKEKIVPVFKLEAPKKSTDLHIAAQEGDVKRIKRLIQGGADIYALNEQNLTPYAVANIADEAAAAWHLQIAEKIQLAAENKISFNSFADLYMKNPQDIEVVLDLSYRLCHDATMEKFAEKIESWRDSGLKKSLKNSSNSANKQIKSSPQLQITAPKLDDQQKTEFQQINKWKVLKVDLFSKRTLDGGTLLHVAAEENFPIITQFLINQKLNINALNNNGETPLHRAIKNNSFAVIDVLIKNNADHSIINNQCETPLITAITDGCVPAIKLLATLPDAACQYDSEGNSALHLATNQNNIELIKYLVKNAFFDINTLNERKETALHCATKNNALATIKTLLKLKANINQKDIDGNTPLHIATAKNFTELITYFIQNGASCTIKNSDGNTPVFIALKNDTFSTSIVSKLFPLIKDGKIVPMGTDCHKKTLLHYENVLNDPILFTNLVKAGHPINNPDIDGNTPLHITIYKTLPTAANYLLEHGADVNMANKKKETPLHAACDHGFYFLCNGIFKKLVSYGANINTKNCLGETPMHVLLRQDGPRNKEGGLDPVCSFTTTQGAVNIALSFLISQGAKVDVENNESETVRSAIEDRLYVNNTKELLTLRDDLATLSPEDIVKKYPKSFTAPYKVIQAEEQAKLLSLLWCCTPKRVTEYYSLFKKHGFRCDKKEKNFVTKKLSDGIGWFYLHLLLNTYAPSIKYLWTLRIFQRFYPPQVEEQIVNCIKKTYFTPQDADEIIRQLQRWSMQKNLRVMFGSMAKIRSSGTSSNKNMSRKFIDITIMSNRR